MGLEIHHWMELEQVRNQWAKREREPRAELRGDRTPPNPAWPRAVVKRWLPVASSRRSSKALNEREGSGVGVERGAIGGERDEGVGMGRWARLFGASRGA